MRQFAALLSLIAMSNAAWAQDALYQGTAPVQNVIVVGQRPGPALWKVSKGNHVMWVFGTYSPLPKNMPWRSQEVETVLARSQELLGQPVTAFSTGWANAFDILPNSPFLTGVKKNADGALLKEVISPDVYKRWLLLKIKYIGGDSGIEEQRPLYAADSLFDRGLFVNGLDSGRGVIARIEQLATNWKITITRTTLKLDLDNPPATMRDFKKVHLDDVDCFTKTVDRLESDIDAMTVRADAWSRGNIDAIRKLNFTDQKQSCNAAVMDSQWMAGVKGTGNLRQRMKASWLAAAEKALAANASTFALLPMADVLNPDGLLAALRAKGYQVDEPE